MTGELYRAIENHILLWDETFDNYIATIPYGAVCLVIDKQSQSPEISRRIPLNLEYGPWRVMFNGTVGYIAGHLLRVRL